MSAPLFLVDPNQELFRWGPVPGRLFFMSEFNDACFTTFPKRFGSSGWIETAQLFFEDRLLWVNEARAIEEMGKRMFLTHVLPRENRQKLYREYQEATVRVRAFQKRLSADRISHLSQEAFLALWKEFYVLVITFWIPTIPPEIGNYGSGSLLEEALRSSVPADEISHVMEVLTAPEKLSFYQEEEIELSETENVHAHAERYHWLKNSYGNCERLSASFFEGRKKHLAVGLRKKMEEHLEEIKHRKKEIIEKYQLSFEVVVIAEGLHDALVWQDERKREIVETIAYKNMLLEEAARRLEVPVPDLYGVLFGEIPQLFLSRDLSILEKRKQGFLVESGMLQGESITRIIEPGYEEMKKLWEKYLEEHVVDDMQFKGIIACKGKGVVRAKVKILLRPEALDTFEEGSVLVAPMTSPEYVFAMKRASAILTDTGGLTSHAAIVSRELGVPCLVGTKVATKVLKDGDEVEVDAEKGIVRRLAENT